ncbi:TIGR03620 family F420-dependent LLM class oxidoreductase [Yinghuangia sp. ASG 101]|uniref:TIGR03620 family F420-dependent LLM class oxidoreductase n=1 Tax=Yinghuangia sp. ASG 101 TaxID=2896848 RepID=UPI001E4FCBE4|nr:TIGR03620 family F420-dependent LLM class oxidoreductase [Yinghuangia sp. ASG 101]UGQ12221.1 TIGR03620 family F420-dependent LLM class oxidoreductase [Yinghuangia sp. ASG 101]
MTQTAGTPDLGRYGAIGAFTYLPPKARDTVAAELEASGFGAIWLANATADEAAPVLDATSAIVVGTAIQSIWRQDAARTAEAYAGLAAKHPGRFVLGLGVSHAQSTAEYTRPYPTMVAYLDALDAAGTPVPAGHRMLAALGPKMTELARTRTAGSLPYLVTAEHVAEARAALGEHALLAPELGVVLEADPDRARTLARGMLERYLQYTNYKNNWLRAGFTEDDVAGGGSDRLIDALFAWGDDDRVRARIEAFRAAGADHIVVQPVHDHPHGLAATEPWRRLAALLP